MLRILKVIYRKSIRIPGLTFLLRPLVKRIRRSNFNYTHATSLETRIIFLESAIAGLEERIASLES